MPLPNIAITFSPDCILSDCASSFANNQARPASPPTTIPIVTRPAIAGANIAPEIPAITDKAVPIAPILSIVFIIVSSLPRSKFSVILFTRSIIPAIAPNTTAIVARPAAIAPTAKPPVSISISPITPAITEITVPTLPSSLITSTIPATLLTSKLKVEIQAIRLNIAVIAPRAIAILATPKATFLTGK